MEVESLGGFLVDDILLGRFLLSIIIIHVGEMKYPSALLTSLEALILLRDGWIE